MHSTNLFTIADAEYRKNLRAKFLGDAIPARSFAVGANEINQAAGIGNIALRNCMRNEDKWPSARRKENVNVWYHSDFKNLAYPFTYKLFDKIVNNETN